MAEPLRPQSARASLADIVAAVGGEWTGAATTQVTGVTLDSRSVRPGDMYAALPGHQTHGARFTAQAVASGAVAVLTDATGAADIGDAGVPVIVCADPRSRLASAAALVYGHPARALQMLGVTGTNGKTTVAAMVEAGLRAAGRVTGTIGTTGVHIGDERFEGVRTTPESTDLQAALAVMRERDVQSVVMEVSSIALAEHRVDEIVYDVAGFTNLTQDHLDYHRSMVEYFEAKAVLFTPAHARWGIVGIDDDWGRQLAEQATIPIETWSLADPRATWSVQRSAGELFAVGPDTHARLSVPMPGAFNVANALLAFAVLRRAGVEADAAAAGIANVTVPGRMQAVQGPRGIRGFVDYAHSPDAIERVLRAAREGTDGRVIAVIGAGGDRDRSKRGQMGQTAARLADVVIVTDDNPRSEDPAAIRAAVLEGAASAPPATRATILEQADRRAAITVAVGVADSGDVILVLGKGHEQGQDIGGVVTPFDDVAVLTEAFASAGAAS